MGPNFLEEIGLVTILCRYSLAYEKAEMWLNLYTVAKSSLFRGIASVRDLVCPKIKHY